MISRRHKEDSVFAPFCSAADARPRPRYNGPQYSHVVSGTFTDGPAQVLEC